MELNQEALYQVAVTLIPGVGGSTARKLIAWAGGAEQVFQKIDLLPETGLLSSRALEALTSINILDSAKRQLEIAEREGIGITSYYDRDFPRKLAQCDDAPLLYYTKGAGVNFDTHHTVGIVGTRLTDPEGRDNIFSLVEGLKNDGIRVIIVSGLASGADTFAHQAALEYGVPTAAVLGHGFDMIYPAENRHIANQIAAGAGIMLTEYFYGHPVSKTNFPRRNRIVAGLCDALVVAQSRNKGGALITAEYARGYRRTVFAYPGRANDRNYQGCNTLIRNNHATLITHHTDLESLMGWLANKQSAPVQIELPLDEPLEPEEVLIVDVLRKHDEVGIEVIASETQIPMWKLSPILLNLEFKDIIKPLPGKRYAVR